MSELRRHIMMQAGGSADCYVLTFESLYYDAYSRSVNIYWEGILVYTIRMTGTIGEFDFGLFRFLNVSDYLNHFRFYQAEDYNFRGHNYPAGDYFEYLIGDITTDLVRYINSPKQDELKFDFCFDYNGGGSNRRICWGFHNFPNGQWVSIGGLLPLQNFYMPFTIQRISAGVDYFGIQANTPFECEGVVYNIGETKLVPWLNPLSTIINKTIRIL